jgi:predicted HAD superfamily Cof-like phosphohydrolase
LIDEEFKELKEAMEKENLVKIADGLADLIYVLYGTAITYGLDMDPIFREVHRSNMSKGDPEIVRSPNGKILKSTNYSPPELEQFVSG